ncbi:hypothetical protein BDV11DRAFT_130017 [Aspergillus similis]
MKAARSSKVDVAQQSVQETTTTTTTTTSPRSTATWDAGKRKERLVLLTAVGGALGLVALLDLFVRTPETCGQCDCLIYSVLRRLRLWTTGDPQLKKKPTDLFPLLERRRSTRVSAGC